MKKCDYCAKEISYYDQYCSDECHAFANKYYEMKEKFQKMFSIINGICVFAIPVGLFLLPIIGKNGGYIISAALGVLGIMFFLLPFPVDNMISKYKLKKAIFLTKILAVVLFVLSIIVLVATFLFL